MVARNKTELASDINNMFDSAGTPRISAADARTVLQNIVDSLALEGSARIFVASAAFDTSTNILTLTVSGPPVSFRPADHIIFVAPANINQSRDAISVDAAPESRRPLVDLDGDDVSAHRLVPGRLYPVARLFFGTVWKWAIVDPLTLRQALPIRTVRRTLTNAELKAINLTAYELIPAPGAGHALEILSVKRSFFGSDRPTITDTEPLHTPDLQSISQLGELIYGFLNPGQPNGMVPVPGVAYTLVDSGHFTGGFWAEGQTFYQIIGAQLLRENRAFSVFWSLQIPTDLNQFWYTDDLFDQMLATANDNTVDIEISYYIRDV